MASRTSATVAAPTAPASSSIGDLYGAVERLKDEAAMLFSSYENDEGVFSLAARAETISFNANQIADTLNSFGNALSILTA